MKIGKKISLFVLCVSLYSSNTLISKPEDGEEAQALLFADIWEMPHETEKELRSLSTSLVAALSRIEGERDTETEASEDQIDPRGNALAEIICMILHDKKYKRLIKYLCSAFYDTEERPICKGAYVYRVVVLLLGSAIKEKQDSDVSKDEGAYTVYEQEILCSIQKIIFEEQKKYDAGKTKKPYQRFYKDNFQQVIKDVLSYLEEDAFYDADLRYAVSFFENPFLAIFINPDNDSNTKSYVSIAGAGFVGIGGGLLSAQAASKAPVKSIRKWVQGNKRKAHIVAALSCGALCAGAALYYFTSQE